MKSGIAPFILPNSLAKHMGDELFEIAFVTRDMDKSIEYLKETYGISKVFRTSAHYPNNKYKGKNVQNHLEFALAWLGNLFIEVIQPSPGDNPFDSYLTDPERLMNFHHFAIQVSNWEKTVEDIRNAGYEFCFEGSGKASFGFIDLTKEMGCMIEVIANGEEFFEKIKRGDY
jgi:hypothetical protein